MPGFDAGQIEATLTLDRSPFQASLAEAQAEAAAFDREMSRVQLGADSSPLTSAIADAQAQLASLRSQSVLIGSSANTEAITSTQAQVATLQAQLDRLNATTAEPKARLDAADVNIKLAQLTAQFDAWGRMSASAQARVDTSAGAMALAALEAQLIQYAAEHPEATAELNIGPALAKVAELKAALGAVQATEAPGRGGGGGAGGGLLAGAVLGGGGAGAAGIMGVGAGLPALGSIGALAGLGPEAILGAGAGLALSGISAALGGVTLAFTAASVAAVGFGTDMAGIGQAAGDIKTVSTDMSNLDKQIALHGPLSQQAAVAQRQLNFDLASFSPVARQAVLQAAQTVQGFKSLFDQATGAAEATGARIITELVQTGEKFLPELGAAAARNMGIIQNGIQPFLSWLSGPGLQIFTDIENKFSADLPVAVHAGTQAFELLARTIDMLLPQVGNFLTTIDNFVTRMNGADFGRWSSDVERLVATFRTWEAFVKALVGDVILLGHDFAGTGTAIIQSLTGMLDRLHAFLASAQGMHEVNAIFEAHKQVILALLQAFAPLVEILGKLEIAIVPALAGAFASLLHVITPLLQAVASNPFTGFLAGTALMLSRMSLLGPVFAGITGAFRNIGPSSEAAGLSMGAVGRQMGALAIAGGAVGFALAGVFGVHGAMADVIAGAGALVGILPVIVGNFAAIRGAVQGLGSMISAAGTSFVSLGAAAGPVIAAIAALTAGIFVLQQHMEDAKAAGERQSQQWTNWEHDIPLNTLDQFNAAIDNSNAQLSHFNQISESSASNTGSLVTRIRDWVTGADQNNAALETTISNLQQFRAQMQNAERDVTAVMHATGLSDTAVTSLANTFRVNLGSASTVDAVRKIQAGLMQLAQQADTTDTALEHMANTSGGSVEFISGAIASSMQKADQAFKGFANQLPQTGQDLSQFYATQTKQAQDFAANINTAIQKGFDPRFIAQMIEAGPQQAGPVLAQAVGQSGTAIITQTKTYEDAMQGLNQQVVEMARLTQHAVQSHSNQMSGDLKEAMQADQIIMSQGGTASVAALAKALGDNEDHVRSVLGEYGILFKNNSDDIAKDGGTAGDTFSRDLAGALASGKPLTQDQIAGLNTDFVNFVNAAGGNGSAAGQTFSQRLNADLKAGVDPVIATMDAYDAALNQGINQILVATGGKPVLATIGGAGGAGGANVPGAAATGGMLVNHPMYIVGEEAPKHPEVVISTNPAYHARNVGLLAQASQMMGLQAGGFMDASQVPQPPTAALLAHGSAPLAIGTGGNSAAVEEYNKVVAFVNAQAAARAAVSSSGGSPFGGGPIKDYMLGEVAKRWPGPAEAAAFDYVEMREAGYDPNAQNPTSSAAGLAQNISGFGPGYERGNVQQQTAWMLNYIGGRYGDPIGAAAHERAFNWYGDGGIFTSPQIIGVGDKGPEAVVPLGQGGAFGGNVTIDARIVFNGDVTDNIDARIQRAHAAQADRITRKLGLRGVTPAPGGILK